MRRAALSFGLSQAPYCTPMLRSVSESSGKGKSFFSANSRFSSTVSKLMPRISVFFSAYRGARSRNPEPSAVQPPVLAFG